MAMKQKQYAVACFDRVTSNTVGPFAPLLLGGTMRENIEQAAELGYHAIELHTREDAPIDWDEVERLLDEYHIRIAQLVTGRITTEGGLDLMQDNPTIADAAEHALYAYIDLAERFHCGLILGWVRGKIPDGGNREVYLGRLAARLRRLCNYAAPKGVPLNIEVLNHYESNVFTTAAELRAFLEKYPGLEGCNIHLDSFHMMLEEEDMIAAIQTAGDRLGYFHVADSTRWYPGSGIMNFPALMDALDKIDYKGYVSVECFRRGDGYATAQKAILYLKQLENEPVETAVL